MASTYTKDAPIRSKYLGARSAARFATFGLTALPLTLSACSWGPIQALTSLSPAVQADTLAYNDAVGGASDRILLSNILRAKYLEPLSLSQLSSVSGTLSLSGTAGFTLPFGVAGSMGGNKVLGQNQAMPSVTGSTQPIYALSPLNTQGFTLQILQPVSTAFILNRWQAGVPRELLLYLFVKEIDFPVLDPTNPNIVIGTNRYSNDPDNEPHFAEFQNLISALMTARAQLKAIDVLDPVGPAFSLYAAVSSTKTTQGTAAQAATATTPAIPAIPATPVTTSNLKTNVDQNAFSLITSSNDGQYHVGNAIDVKTVSNGGQLYRVYSDQVQLCADAALMAARGFIIPPIAPRPTAARVPATAQAEQSNEQAEQGRALAAEVVGAAANAAAPSTPAGGGAKGPTGGGGGGGGGGGTSAASSSSQGMTAALQAGRVSALVNDKGCHADEVVLHKFSEKDFANASKRFVHIQWRSVSEIFDYLGAILRYNERHSSPSLAKPFRFAIVNDDTVIHTDVSASFPSEPVEQPPSGAILFVLYKNSPGRLYINFDGDFYTVKDPDPTAPGRDYTMPIISMLSTLVNYASQPSTISTSTPLRLLPIPLIQRWIRLSALLVEL